MVNPARFLRLRFDYGYVQLRSLRARFARGLTTASMAYAVGSP